MKEAIIVFVKTVKIYGNESDDELIATAKRNMETAIVTSIEKRDIRPYEL